MAINLNPTQNSENGGATSQSAPQLSEKNDIYYGMMLEDLEIKLDAVTDGQSYLSVGPESEYSLVKQYLSGQLEYVKRGIDYVMYRLRRGDINLYVFEYIDQNGKPTDAIITAWNIKALRRKKKWDNIAAKCYFNVQRYALLKVFR